MNYGKQNIDYSLNSTVVDVVDNYDDHGETPQLQYSRKRSATAFRKRGSKRRKASHPGCGISGRRNRQYSW